MVLLKILFGSGAHILCYMYVVVGMPRKVMAHSDCWLWLWLTICAHCHVSPRHGEGPTVSIRYLVIQYIVQYVQYRGSSYCRNVPKSSLGGARGQGGGGYATVDVISMREKKDQMDQSEKKK